MDSERFYRGLLGNDNSHANPTSRRRDLRGKVTVAQLDDKISILLWNPNLHHHVHKNPPLEPVLGYCSPLIVTCFRGFASSIHSSLRTVLKGQTRIYVLSNILAPPAEGIFRAELNSVAWVTADVLGRVWQEMEYSLDTYLRSHQWRPRKTAINKWRKLFELIYNSINV
jgi:hypothetical protein